MTALNSLLLTDRQCLQRQDYMFTGILNITAPRRCDDVICSLASCRKCGIVQACVSTYYTRVQHVGPSENEWMNKHEFSTPLVRWLFFSSRRLYTWTHAVPIGIIWSGIWKQRAWQLFLLNERNQQFDGCKNSACSTRYKRFYSPSTAPWCSMQFTFLNN